MKFTCSVEINLPRHKVIDLWENPDHMVLWQDGLQSFEHLSGERGKIGAQSKMVYKNGKREFDLIETIIENNLPESFIGEYAADSMVNTMRNTFTEVNSSSTTWTADIEYSKFNGFLPKLMGLFMGGLFKKQTQKWLDQFKNFAESQALEG
jgi:uncharacterized membrane protein